MSIYWLRLNNTRFPLRFGETVVGRSPYCTIVLNDAGVSREHAALRLSGNGLWLEDLQSLNGTLVNGAPISKACRLTAGDTVHIGASCLHVQVSEGERTQSYDTLSPAPPGYLEQEPATQAGAGTATLRDLPCAPRNQSVAAELRSAILELSEELERSPETAAQGAQLASMIQDLGRRGRS